MDEPTMDEPRTAQLERLLAVGRSLVSVAEPDEVLDHVIEAARDLTGARYAALGVLDRDGDGLERFIFTGMDEETRAGIGDLPRGLGILGELIRHPEPLRLEEIGAHPRSHGFPGGHPPMSSFLGVPICIRHEVFGNLYLTEKEGGGPFSDEDERLLVVLAEWAAIAIEGTRSLAAEKLRLSIESSELERRRWARELHDETLQELGALRVMQEGALRASDPEAAREALARAGRQVESVIASLQGLITDLRPAALDQLGPQSAIEALVERITERSDLTIDLDFDLAYEGGRVRERLTPELEAAIYRIVQEALSNVVKHAEADRARVLVEEREDSVVVTVEDDGDGFAPRMGGRGFGIVGMRERAELLGGRFEVRTALRGRGCRVRAELPVSRVGEA
ncbi:MAG: GAF domain-containing sensor histidine kinase [Solirubrobacterales bacterium]